MTSVGGENNRRAQLTNTRAPLTTTPRTTCFPQGGGAAAGGGAQRAGRGRLHHGHTRGEAGRAYGQLRRDGARQGRLGGARARCRGGGHRRCQEPGAEGLLPLPDAVRFALVRFELLVLPTAAWLAVRLWHTRALPWYTRVLCCPALLVLAADLALMTHAQRQAADRGDVSAPAVPGGSPEASARAGAAFVERGAASWRSTQETANIALFACTLNERIINPDHKYDFVFHV
jgi:hypothetical protein